jgi:hypothetical protein
LTKPDGRPIAKPGLGTQTYSLFGIAGCPTPGPVNPTSPAWRLPIAAYSGGSACREPENMDLLLLPWKPGTKPRYAEHRDSYHTHSLPTHLPDSNLVLYVLLRWTLMSSCGF